MQYFDIQDLNRVHAARNALLVALTTDRLTASAVKLIVVNDQLLRAFRELADNEIYLQPGSIDGWERFRGYPIEGKADLGHVARLISVDGTATEIQL